MAGERELMARVIASSYGVDPDDDAPLSVVCTSENRPLPWWCAYEEQADAILAAGYRRDQPADHGGEVGYTAAFLLDRLDEIERDLLDDEVGNDFHGHVSPAMARLRAALDATTSAGETTSGGGGDAV